MVKILIDKFKVNEFNIISLFQQLNMMAMFGSEENLKGNKIKINQSIKINCS